MNKWMMTVLTALVCQISVAQSVPVPGKSAEGPVLLKNGVIHPGKGLPAFTGSILFEMGKIVSVGPSLTLPSGGSEVDLKGGHVYPGLIACNTQLGLEEVEAVRATLDSEESGSVNPNARALVAYNTDSKVTPTVRSNGVLLAQVSPKGGLFSGTSSVVQLDAWNWEDAAYLADDALHVNWPDLQISTGRWAPPVEEQKKRISESLDRIEQVMMEAKAYSSAKEAGLLRDHDLRWEAMIPVLKKQTPVWVHANSELQIRSAVAFSIKHAVKLVLVGAQDAIHCVDLLHSHKIPVVLFPPHSLPVADDSDVDQPYKSAAQLHTAGLKVAISQDGFWQQRNLPFLAGTVASHGLDSEQALALITSNPAEILGIGGRTGSLEPGMDATLLVSKGDLLDMRSSDVTQAWIQGRAVDLGNHQKDLYQKFINRP